MASQPEHNPAPLTATIAVDADHPAFAGHFDGFPIIAGVYQLDWVVEALSRHHSCPVVITAIPKAKFTAMIRPGAKLQLTVTPRVAASGFSATWRLVSTATETAADTKAEKFSEGRVEYTL